MARIFLTIFFGLLLAGYTACRPQVAGLELTGRSRLDSITSGSALLVQADSAWIVGDDAPALYRLDLLRLRATRLPFPGFEGGPRRLSKSVKQDLEAATLANWQGAPYLFAFGSGTLSPHRDSLLLFPLQVGAPRMLSAAPLYRHLQRSAGIAPEEWNLEGAAASGDTLFLLNRGSNAVLRCSLGALLAFVMDTTAPAPTVTAQVVKLPLISGQEARFSGASPAGPGRLIFSASVEATAEWTKDGAVLGSFIGIYDTERGRVESIYPLTGKDGKPLKEKLESVDVLRREGDGRLSLLAIADNDDGSTNLLRLTLRPAR